MSGRRSSRAKQTVNYSGLDGQSDDDFADDTPPPPPKKTKSSKKDEASKRPKKKDDDWEDLSDTETTSLNKVSDSSRKRRVPLSEKTYEKQLQEALQLSVLETGGSQDLDVHDKAAPVLIRYDEDDFKHSNTSSNKGSAVTKETNEDASHKAVKETTSKSSIAPGTVVLDDSIEYLGEVDEESKSTKQKPQRAVRKQTAKKQATVESDDESRAESDFNPGEKDDESDSDDGDEDDDFSAEDSADSDFDDRSKKTKQAKTKAGKVSPTQKHSKPTSKTRKAPAPPKQPAKPQVSKSGTAGSSVSKSPATKPCTARPTLNNNPGLASSWKPPSRASPGNSLLPTIRSPSSGLRIGLSRNQRVKPLHPSVKVS